MDTALATFQPSGISSDFNEKSDRLCVNSSAWSSHSFWICVQSRWPAENWWFHPVALTCVRRSINFSSPLFNFKECICSNECSSIRARSSACHTKYGCCCAILCFTNCLILWLFFFSHCFSFSQHCRMRFGHVWLSLCVCGLHWALLWTVDVQRTSFSLHGSASPSLSWKEHCEVETFQSPSWRHACFL